MKKTFPTPAFESLVEVSALVEAFENHTLPRERWDHAAHLVVALWYLVNFPTEVATQEIRQGIRAYNVAVGITNTATSGYHETRTLFWLRILEYFLADTTELLSINALANALLAGPLADPNLPLLYYSQAHLLSAEARMRWVEPDLKTLPILDQTPNHA
jgi:hypothetical protein